MHVHVPKPLHGWKAFANEIVVIVIGVLIALGLEQVAENIHWRHKVEEGEERLRGEGRQMFLTAAEQVIFAPCVQAQYDALADRVVASGDRLDPAERLPVSPSLKWYRQRGRLMAAVFNGISTPVWRALERDGTTLHMEPARVRRIAQLYDLADIFNQQMADGFFPPDNLAEPLPLDPATRSALLMRLDDTNRHFANMANRAAQIMANLRDTGLAPQPAEADRLLAESRRNNYANVDNYCRAHGLPLADWKAVLAGIRPRPLD